MKRSGFTLVEILVVIGIIMMLSALLFPVLGSAREKARASSCQSNLRQLGQAITIYAQDYDRYPRGLDPADKYAPQIWNGNLNTNSNTLNETPMLCDVVAPYIKEPTLWRCPSDSGFEKIDLTNTPLLAKPSSYEKFAMSYLYRTDVTFLNLAEEHLYSPTETILLADASGAWHSSSSERPEGRYNILFADGHVKNLGYADYDALWEVPLKLQ